MKRIIFLIPFILSGYILTGQMYIIKEILSPDFELNKEIQVDSTEEVIRDHRKRLLSDEFYNPSMKSIDDITTKCTYKDNLVRECKSVQSQIHISTTTFQYDVDNKITQKTTKFHDSRTLIIKYDTLENPIWAIAKTGTDTIFIESAYYQKDSILINVYNFEKGESKHLILPKLNGRDDFRKSRTVHKKGKSIEIVVKDPIQEDKDYTVRFKLDRNKNWITKTIQSNGIGSYISTITNTKRTIYYHTTE